MQTKQTPESYKIQLVLVFDRRSQLVHNGKQVYISPTTLILHRGNTMGLSAITALEIYTNPEDLEFAIGEDEESGKWSLVITRGPSHHFKLLLSADGTLGSKAEAIKQIGLLLKTAREEGRRTLTDPESFIGKIVNPKGLAPEDMEILTDEQSERILEELRSSNVSSTYPEDASESA